MSYICLAMSREGAVMAGDSRLTVPVFPTSQTFHLDMARKVYRSAGGATLWGWTGLVNRGLIHFPTVIRWIMGRDEVPIDERLEQVKRFLCRFTRPFRIKKSKPQAPIVNLIYCVKNPEGGYLAGSLCVYNGKVYDEKRYGAPVFLEDGMNMRQLSHPRFFRPGNKDAVVYMRDRMRVRVRESIDKDRSLGEADPNYLVTIGGPIKVVCMR